MVWLPLILIYWALIFTLGFETPYKRSFENEERKTKDKTVTKHTS